MCYNGKTFHDLVDGMTTSDTYLMLIHTDKNVYKEHQTRARDYIELKLCTVLIEKEM